MTSFLQTNLILIHPLLLCGAFHSPINEALIIWNGFKGSGLPQKLMFHLHIWVYTHISIICNVIIHRPLLSVTVSVSVFNLYAITKSLILLLTRVRRRRVIIIDLCVCVCVCLCVLPLIFAMAYFWRLLVNLCKCTLALVPDSSDLWDRFSMAEIQQSKFKKTLISSTRHYLFSHAYCQMIIYVIYAISNWRFFPRCSLWVECKC